MSKIKTIEENIAQIKTWVEKCLVVDMAIFKAVVALASRIENIEKSICEIQDNVQKIKGVV